MPAAAIRSFSVDVFEAPLKRPFVTALGRKTTSVNIGLTLRLSGGASGYGEASSSLALAHLRPRRLAGAVESLARESIGADTADWGALAARAWRRYPEVRPAVAAFESAVVSALCASRGLSLSDFFGGKLARLSTDATLSAVGPEETFAHAREAARDGFKTLKVKVGGAFADDRARVAAARRAAPKARLLLDGNQGLSPAGALKLVEACLKEGPIELLEQPVRKEDIKGLAFVAKRCPVPVAADEACATPADAARLATERAATAINVKVAKSGLGRALEIAALARAAGLPLMIGCMTETARGLESSVGLAMGTGFFRWVDLDSDYLLAGGGRNKSDVFRRRGPTLEALSRAGSGTKRRRARARAR